MDGYKHRIMDILLEKKLQAKGAVLIEGPKWCGKTTTAEEIASSKIMLARTDVKNNFCVKAIRMLSFLFKEIGVQ